MMTNHGAPQLFLVDVFAEQPYAGNQLAVVVGADPSEWPTARMQAFAREMNFSETTFASAAPRDGAWDVRIFTPADELPFAGHPTLGTAWVLRRFFAQAGTAGLPSTLSLRLGIGVVPVEFESSAGGELVRMRPRTPVVGDVLDGIEMAAHLGIDPSLIDTKNPCRRVSIGVEFVIVPLRDLAALKSCRPLSLPAHDPGVLLGVMPFARQAYDDGGDLSVRVFFDANGMREDPATGSAAACLAAYLAAEGVLPGPAFTARLQQGYEMGRPSCLTIGAQTGDGGTGVHVAGKVVLVARGEVA